MEPYKKGLSAQELALYFGQQAASVDIELGEALAEFRIEGDALDMKAQRGENYPESEGIAWKPILRPLSDMTEEEGLEIFELYADKPYLASIASHESLIEWLGGRVGSPAHWRYLLSRGFDLFGWIDAGLAIDKTKVNENAVNP